MAKRKIQLRTDVQTDEHEARIQALNDVGLKIWTSSDIKDKELIGVGTYGKVELVSTKYHETTKSVLKTMVDDQEFFKRFIKEIKVLFALQHPHIVSILGVVANPLALMLEYVAFNFEPYGVDDVVTTLGGFLKKLHALNAVRTFQEEYDIFRLITNQTAQGMSYLHNKSIAHRDLKPSNILVGNTTNGVVDDSLVIYCKIADFGEARSPAIQTNTALSTRTSSVDRGTIPFQAPEAILGYLKTVSLSDLKMVDVWGYGCILFCILNPDLDYPFQKEFKADTSISKDLKRCIAALFNKRHLPEHSATYSDLREILEDIENVLARCLSFVPASRPTFENILERFNSGRQSEHIIRDAGPASKTRSLAVVVTDIPPDIDADYLELWFESEHRSGGDVMEDFYSDELSTNKSVTITYKSAEVAERVAEMTQRPKGIQVNVKLLTADPNVTEVEGSLDDRLVLVTNVPSGSSTKELHRFFHRYENSSIESVECGANPAKALVVFECPIDFMKLARTLQLRPYRGTILSVQQVVKTKGVQVNGVKGLVDYPIDLYFESDRNGGGRIVKYDAHFDEDYVLIHFEMEEVSHSVLEGKHTINGHQLCVSKLYDCLGVIDSHYQDGVQTNMGDYALEVLPTKSALDNLHMRLPQKPVLDTIHVEDHGGKAVSQAVVVTDIPPDMDMDYLELWFESERRSGGGIMEDFFCDDFKKDHTVTITYKSVKVAWRVKNVPQSPKGSNLKVELLTPAVNIPCAVDDHKVLVKNIPAVTKNSDLCKFFSRLMIGSIEHVERSESLSNALVTFREPTDFSKTIELTSMRPFRGRMLSLEQVSTTYKSIVEELQTQAEENNRKRQIKELENDRPIHARENKDAMDQLVKDKQFVRDCTVTVEDCVALNDADKSKFKSLNVSFSRRHHGSCFPLFGSGNPSVVLTGAWNAVHDAIEYLEEKYGDGTTEEDPGPGASLVRNQATINRSFQPLKSKRSGADTSPRTENSHCDTHNTEANVWSSEIPETAPVTVQPGPYTCNPQASNYVNGGATPKVREPQSNYHSEEACPPSTHTYHDTKPRPVSACSVPTGNTQIWNGKSDPRNNVPTPKKSTPGHQPTDTSSNVNETSLTPKTPVAASGKTRHVNTEPGLGPNVVQPASVSSRSKVASAPQFERPVPKTRTKHKESPTEIISKETSFYTSATSQIQKGQIIHIGSNSGGTVTVNGSSSVLENGAPVGINGPIMSGSNATRKKQKLAPVETTETSLLLSKEGGQAIETSQNASAERKRNDTRKPISKSSPIPTSGVIHECMEKFTAGLYQWLWYKNRHVKHFNSTISKNNVVIREEVKGTSIEITLQSKAGNKEAAKECKKEIGETLDWINTKDEFISEPLHIPHTVDLASIKCPSNTYMCKDSSGCVLVLAETEGDIQAVKEKLRQRPIATGAAAEKSSKPVDQIDMTGPVNPKSGTEKRKRTSTSPGRNRRKGALAKKGGSYRHIYGQLIHVFIGDITKLMVGAVVNASNPNLVHGGGVAGAIKKAAGPGMEEECNNRVQKNGPIQISQVYCSASYNMLCQCIVHVAGPRWSEYADKKQAEADLFHSFLNCLLEAERLRQPSIAIPAVGSGIYGCPLRAVAQQMYTAVLSFLNTRHDNSHVRDILFVDISIEVVDLLTDIMAKEASVGTVSIIEPSFQSFITDTSCVINISDSQNMATGSTVLPTAVSSNKPANMVNPCDSEEGATRTQEGILNMLQASSSAIDADDNCAICMEKPTDKVVLPNCGHVYCKECIGTWFKDKPTCPNCGQIYGEMRGDQPDGTMTVRKIVRTIPGYDDTEGAIVISYQFHDGIQQACHPNPGSPYYGTSRTGFLPDNEEGKHVLSLLRRAFDARLTFTIGRSTTTGRDGQITWNDIHHKTNINGGPERFGYPDPTYLSRVKEELAAKGIK